MDDSAERTVASVANAAKDGAIGDEPLNAPLSRIPPTPEPRGAATIVEIPVATYVRELSERARLEIREELVRSVQVRASIIAAVVGGIGLVIALGVLLYGNSMITSLVQTRIDGKLAEFEKARIEATVAGKMAESSAAEASQVARQALSTSKQVESDLRSTLDTFETRMNKLNGGTRELEEQVLRIQSTVHGVIDSAVEAAVAQLKNTVDETFLRNSKIPVYVWTSDDSKTIEIIRQLSPKGFRVAPIQRAGRPPTRTAQLVYSDEGVDSNVNDKELLLHAAQEFGLPYPIREVSRAEREDGTFPQGITIALP